MNYKKEFPKRLRINNTIYDINCILESHKQIKVSVELQGDYIITYVFKKDKGYMNVVFFETMLCRNLEGFIYWEEVKMLGDILGFHDREKIFKKYWGKGFILPRK